MPVGIQKEIKLTEIQKDIITRMGHKQFSVVYIEHILNTLKDSLDDMSCRIHDEVYGYIQAVKMIERMELERGIDIK